MKRTRRVLIYAAAAAVILALITALSGCGPSKAREYAREARSSYISARAVLVGLQKFPSEMEELLRAEDLESVGEDARDVMDDARDLVTSSINAFRDCREKCERLKGEGDEEFNAYADMLLELVSLNEQVINTYSEYIGTSSSILQNIPYYQDPLLLMPSLDYLNDTIFRIEELMEQMKQKEEEAEQLYRTLTE